MPFLSGFLAVVGCFIWAPERLDGLVFWMPLNALQRFVVIPSLCKGCWLEVPQPCCEVQKVLRIWNRPVVMTWIGMDSSRGDCLVGIAAGGTTPYVRGGLSYARSIGALAIAMACVPKDQAPLPCDIDIRLITGPELLTGSTRLKAGTATKMALNLLSTSVMVRLGKVYGNRMVDVAASNSKLVDRSLRILRDLIGVDRDEGLALLGLSDGSVKLALLMKAADLSKDQAKNVLDQHDQQLRPALETCGVRLAQL